MSPSDPAAVGPAVARTVVVAVLAAALPLLINLPVGVAIGIAAVALVSAWSALRRPLPRVLRVLLVILISGAVLVGFGFRVGRDAGSALMLSMLVLKLAELRALPDARRVVAYALFAPFAAFLQDQGPLTLLLGLTGAVAVLVGMARLAESPAPALPPREEALRIGRGLAMALPLALVGFWLFPRLPTPLWGLPENAVARTGISESMSPGDWLDFIADDRPAFRVRFDGPTPDLQSMYWRGPVLGRFDGRTWSRLQGFGGFPAPALPESEDALSYTLTLEPTERRYVFALESPADWPSTLELGADATLRSRLPLRGLSQYRLQAHAPRPYEPTLHRDLRRAYLALPSEYNPRTLERARQWRDASADDRAYIQRVLAWFNAEHAYNIAAPPLGRHTADEFLFDTKEGFCEHFSSAFVILMRGAGIPARVVTGYAGGDYNRMGGYWVVRQLNAHAWSEVWLEGEGWVRVDPTAAVAPERVFQTIDDLEGGGFGDALRPVFDFGDSLRETWNNFVVGYDAIRQAQLLRDLGWKNADPMAVGQAFVIAAGIALGLTLLILLRPVGRERDPLMRAWRRFLGRWARRGLAKGEHESAGAFARRLREAHGASPAEAVDLVERFVALRYAVTDGDNEEARRALAADLEKHRPPPSR